MEKQAPELPIYTPTPSSPNANATDPLTRRRRHRQCPWVRRRRCCRRNAGHPDGFVRHRCCRLIIFLSTLGLVLWLALHSTFSLSSYAFSAPSFSSFVSGSFYATHGPAVSLVQGVEADADDKPLVALEAHIMSKCPDARDCLRDLVLPVMQRTHDKVNFTLSYIGMPTDENDGVHCKHGPEECLGNIVELCAAHLNPDPKIYLGFTMCLSKDYRDLPQRSLIEDCALEHAVNFTGLNECATQDDGAFGIGMLRESVAWSADAGVTKSCTIRLDSQIYCIRDNGIWTDCPQGPSVDVLTAAIEDKYATAAKELHRA